VLVSSSEGSLKTLMLRGASWSAAQRWISRLAAMAAFVVLSRLLQPSDFGLVALASSVIAVLQLVSEGGFSTYLVRATSISSRTISTAFWTALTLSVVCAAAVLGVAPLLARAFGEPGLSPVLMVLSISVIITGLGSVQSALLSREMAFKKLAQQQLAAGLSSTVVALALALAGAGVWALVAQSLVLAVVSTSALWLSSSWRPSREWDWSESKKILSFSWKVLAASLLQQFRDRGEQFIIAGIGGTVLLGYWTIASRILQIMMDLTVTVLQSVTLPVFSRIREDPERLRRGYRQVLTATAVIVTPVVVIVSQTSEGLVPLVFGPQWLPTAHAASLVTLGGLAWAMNSFDRSLYQSFGRPGVDLILSAAIAVVQVVAVFLATPHGLTALAVVNLIRAYGVWPVRLAVLKRTCGLPWNSYTGLPPVLLAGALSWATLAGVEAWLLPAAGWIGLSSLAAIGAVTYVLFVLVLSRDARTGARAVVAVIHRRRRRPGSQGDETTAILTTPGEPLP
jgi:O-antigen/teichoic acid export membrane protein